jgi:hypothetical protein
VTDRQAKIIGLSVIVAGSMIGAQIGLLTLATDAGSRRFEWGLNVAMGLCVVAGILFLIEYFRSGQ